jgi:hypothetical protein
MHVDRITGAHLPHQSSMISIHVRARRGAARIARVATCMALAGCATTPARPREVVMLEPQRDSFAILVQGRAIGTEVSRLQPAATGWLYTDVTTLPGVEQATEVLARADGSVEHMHQRLQRSPISAVSDLTYDAGRVRGTVQLPTQAGGVEILIVDTVAVPGVVDDNFVAALLPSLAWAPGASLTLPVFVGGKNATQQWTFRVVGTESVTVPAGTFPAYRTELQVGPQLLVTYIEVARPHRVLKRVPVGSPLEFVRLP